MKKVLVILSLMLAIVTSLTAGTMAAYTTQVSAISKDVTAKKFLITGEGDTNFAATDLSIGPGGELWYKFTIQNETYDKDGISADVDFTAEIGGELAKVCKIELLKNQNDTGNTFKVYTDKGDVVNTVLGKNSTTSSINKVGVRFINMSLLAKEGNKTVQTVTSKIDVYLKVTWPYTNNSALDNSMVFNADGTPKTPETLSLKVTLNAMSHNIHKKLNADGTSNSSDMDLERSKVEALDGAEAAT